jgi:hypothetical protein
MLKLRGIATLDKFVVENKNPGNSKDFSRYGLTVVEDPDTFNPLELDRAKV